LISFQTETYIEIFGFGYVVLHDQQNVIKLGFYSYLDGAITGGDPFQNALLASGELRPFYIAAPPDDKIPKVECPFQAPVDFALFVASVSILLWPIY
jgi:hypothetical protein